MFAVFALAVIILYILLISRFIKGWDELSDFDTDKMPSQIPVSIITAFKNEEKNLPLLAQALENQTYQNFEWILVNDHSTDSSEEVMKQIISQGMFGVKVIENDGNGKKRAIRTGIQKSKNEWIISLDADVALDKNWLLNIVAYQEKQPSDLLICPVKIEQDKTFWQKFQQYEFASLIASGAGASKVGMPMLCNGANLAFKKSVWLRNEKKLHFEELSGDDIYLLQAVKRNHGAIRFLKSTAATAKTSASKSLGEFLRQRKRWAGKKAMFADRELFVTALLVFLASAVVLATAVVAFFDRFYPSLLLLIFMAKFITDLTMFLKIKDFFDLKNVVIYSLVFSLLYPFYVFFTGLSSLFVRNKW